MTIPEFAISLGGNLLLLLLFLGVAIVLAFVFYRVTIPPLPPRKRLVLATVRGFALSVLLLLVFEPLLKLIVRHEQPPIIAVLIDDSESMMIADRHLQIRKFINDNPFASTPATVRYYRFSSHLEPVRSLQADSLRFAGEVTDLAAALLQIKESRAKDNVQASVVLTDGNFTVGKNPLAVTEDFGMPLYTIGVGDTTEQRDVLIAKVTTNNIVYAETRVPVDVRVHSSGYKGEKIEVTLNQGNTALDRKILQLQEGKRDYTVSLRYEPKEEGTQKYTVAISPLPGELTHKNNVSSFFVKVLKTKLHILVLAGAPSPDVSVVRQTLSEQLNFSVQTRIEKSSDDFYEGALSPAVLDSADCLVLVGFPSPATSPRQIQQVHDAVERLKKPILFVSSRTLDVSKLKLLEGFLPASWTNASAEEILVFPEVAERQHTHVLVQLDANVTSETWQQLPPIFKSQTVVRAKPEAEVLAFAQPDRGSPERPGRAGLAGKIQSVAFNEPLILTRNIAQNKSFAITGHGIWRWRLLAQGARQTEQFLPLLLTNSVRWLTTRDEGKRVRVSPTKEAFTTAESIEFTGEVYDEQLRPVENAEVRIEVSTKAGAREQSQKFETILRSIGSGRYEGSLEGLGMGDYTFAAHANVDEKSLGEDRGKFSVGQMNVEFLATTSNKQLLEQLAYRTGGLYADIRHANTLVDSLRLYKKFTPREIIQTSELELWNWQYLLGILTALLATEWFVRKSSGLL